METRLAKFDDLEQLKEVFIKIIEKMYLDGNDIWNEYYPTEVFEEEINNKELYVLLER